MITASIDTKEIESDLRLFGKELEQAQKFALRDTLRRLQTVARREAREATGLKASSTNRRVRAYTNQGRVWLGGRPPLAASVGRPRVAIGRLPRGSSAGRSVTVDGQLVEGGFVPRSGRAAGRSFRKLPNGSLEAIRVDVAPQIQGAFRSVLQQVPEIYEREFRSTVDRLVSRS